MRVRTTFVALLAVLLMKVMLFGATGMVGQGVLRERLGDDHRPW
jgi:hypothetical protein